MAVSMTCEECLKVKRCKMYSTGSDGKLTAYLCAVCARKLESGGLKKGA
jgi:hypothetical protein